MVPCGRLSWLLVCFWAHVNIVISYRIVDLHKPFSRPLKVYYANDVIARCFCSCDTAPVYNKHPACMLTRLVTGIGHLCWIRLTSRVVIRTLLLSQFCQSVWLSVCPSHWWFTSKWFNVLYTTQYSDVSRFLRPNFAIQNSGVQPEWRN